MAFADLGGNAVFRATLKRDFTIDDETFLHATMAVDSISTNRRYPQLMVSSAPRPMWNNMDKGVTVVMQWFGEVPSVLNLEVCDHDWWAVNDQCPTYFESVDLLSLLESASRQRRAGPRPAVEKHVRALCRFPCSTQMFDW